MLATLKALEKLVKGGIFLAISLMIISVVVQVVARSVMSQPPIWTEEMSRVALLYIMGLGVGASVLTGDLVNVDLVLMHMSKKWRRGCELLSSALVSAFGFLLVPGSWEFTELGEMQTSPVLNIQMNYVFFSTLVFAVLLGVFGLVKFIQILFNVQETEFTPHNTTEA